MKRSTKLIVRFIIPLVAIAILFTIGRVYGFIAAAAYMLFLVLSDLPSIYTAIGTANYQKGNMEKALEWLAKAYKTGRSKPRTAISYGYLLLKCEKVAEAESILTRLLESKLEKDDEMLARSNLALVLWKSDRLDQAVALLEEVIREYKTTVVYGSLGYLSILKGDLDRALEINTEAFEYNNSNGIIQDNLGQTYYMRGEDDRALEIYEKLIASNPTFPEAYYNYAMVLTRTGQKDKALEMLRKALGYRFTFLNGVRKEEVEAAIEQLQA